MKKITLKENEESFKMLVKLIEMDYIGFINCIIGNTIFADDEGQEHKVKVLSINDDEIVICKDKEDGEKL